MLNKKALVILMLVCFGASWAAYAIFKGGLSGLFSGKKPVEEKMVFVAAFDIPSRLALAEPMFVRQPVPLQMYNENMVSQFDPKVPVFAKTSIGRGEILYKDRLGLVNEEPELSYMVDWNQGCVTLHVNDVKGVSGLLRPGDYVDVYATFHVYLENEAQKPSSEMNIWPEEKPEQGKVSTYSTTKRILGGLKVVATDMEVLPPAGGGQNINRVRATAPDVKRVTLAGTTTQLEKLIQAYNKAEIHLALISDAVKKMNERLSFDTGFIKIETVRGENSEFIYVER